MITPLDLIYQAASQPEPVEAHYHLAARQVYTGPDAVEMANFHLINRNIDMNQIGFDYYYNVVTYRV
ncbi:MAG: hypothetical protein Q4F27_04105 [Desulfovibrionaceae bacterium]|nr:hypothetical protein [Desulfovibrionaceae bacterium]